MTPRCPMYRGIETPRGPKYWGVETPRCPMYQGVKTPQYFGSQNSPVSYLPGSLFLFLWTFKSMLQPLKQHSFKKQSTSSIKYTNTFDLWLKNLKFLQNVDHIVVYNLWKFQIDSSQIEITTNIFFTQTVKKLAGSQSTGESVLPDVQSTGEWFYCLYEIFRTDLNWWAINLKFSQIVENYVTYNLWKFQIDSIKIEA